MNKVLKDPALAPVYLKKYPAPSADIDPSTYQRTYYQAPVRNDSISPDSLGHGSDASESGEIGGAVQGEGGAHKRSENENIGTSHGGQGTEADRTSRQQEAYFE